MQLLRHRTPADGNDENRGATVRRRLARPLSATGGRAVVVAGVAIAIGVAPVALAANSGPSAKAARASGKSTLVGGIHNPANSAFSKTTGLFGNTKGWVARIKNQGAGGSATLECKSATGGSCLEANNKSTGFAFDFTTSGSTGGTIQLKNTEGAPFTTNAHGVATGLNANYLQGREASAFQLAADPAAKATEAEKLGGKTASEYVTTAQVLFATVANEKIESTRGATSVSKTGSTYTVVFGAEVSKCAYTASPEGAPLETGAIGVAPTPGNVDGVNVILPESYTGGFDLQVDC
jgi:hypothetical protein